MSEDWQKKIQYREDEARTLKFTIETLRNTITDTSKQLSTCVDHSKTLQNDLTLCRSSLGICTTNLKETENKYANVEAIIINLKGEVASLEAGKKRCETEISSLRCDTNQFLAIIEGAEKKAYQALIDVQGIMNGCKSEMDKFVGSHDISCKA